MMKRQNVTAYFPIGAGKTAEIHRVNADGSISPVVDDIGESGHVPLPRGADYVAGERCPPGPPGRRKALCAHVISNCNLLLVVWRIAAASDWLRRGKPRWKPPPYQG